MPRDSLSYAIRDINSLVSSRAVSFRRSPRVKSWSNPFNDWRVERISFVERITPLSWISVRVIVLRYPSVISFPHRRIHWSRRTTMLLYWNVQTRWYVLKSIWEHLFKPMISVINGIPSVSSRRTNPIGNYNREWVTSSKTKFSAWKHRTLSKVMESAVRWTNQRICLFSVNACQWCIFFFFFFFSSIECSLTRSCRNDSDTSTTAQSLDTSLSTSIIVLVDRWTVLRLSRDIVGGDEDLDMYHDGSIVE